MRTSSSGLAAAARGPRSLRRSRRRVLLLHWQFGRASWARTPSRHCSWRPPWRRLSGRRSGFRSNWICGPGCQVPGRTSMETWRARSMKSGATAGLPIPTAQAWIFSRSVFASSILQIRTETKSFFGSFSLASMSRFRVICCGFRVSESSKSSPPPSDRDDIHKGTPHPPPSPWPPPPPPPPKPPK